jgi:hypothetical protein
MAPPYPLPARRHRPTIVSCHGNHRRCRARKIRCLRDRSARTDRSAAGRGAGQDRGERHVPDRPARSRRLLQHALSRGLRPRRCGRGASRRQQRDQIRTRRSRRHLVSMVRRLPELSTQHAVPLHAGVGSENARHARRRFDAHAQGRRGGLQRVLPAILVCDPCHCQRTLHGEGQEGRAARAVGAIRLQRADRRRRGAQPRYSEWVPSAYPV